MRFKVKVYPSSSREGVIKEEDGSFKVRVTSPPEHGKANKALLRLLAKKIRIAKSNLSIPAFGQYCFTVKSGIHSRTKIIEAKDE